MVGYYYLGIIEAGDTVGYFQSAVELNQTMSSDLIAYFQGIYQAELPTHASNWHSVFFVKMISPIVFLSNGNYWLTAIYLTLVNFLLSWTALRYLLAAFNRKWLLYIAIFGIPSVLTWSGGVFKESVANGLFLLFLGILIYCIHTWKKPSLFETVVLFMAGLLIFHLRFYLLGIALGYSISLIWIRRFVQSKNLLWGGLVAFFLLAFISAQWLHPWLRPTRLPLTLYENYEQLHSQTATSNFYIPGFQPNYWGLIIASPLALFTGWFRPFLWELPTIHWIPFALEKLSFLFLLLSTFYSIKNIRFTPHVSVSLLWLAILTISITLTTPNFGTLMRYSSVFLPFLFLILGYYPLRKIDAIR